MKAANDDLLRWRETSADPRALSARAADLVDAVREVPPLEPAALARIKAQVLSRRPSRAGRGLPLGVRFAVLMMVVLASVATAKGTIILWRRFVAASTPATTMTPAATATARARPRSRAAVEAPTVAPVAALEPAAAPEPTPVPVLEVEPAPVRAPPAAASAAHRRFALAAPSAARAAAAPAPTPTTEAQLLAGALARLRQAHDPVGAVALLDQYARTFPHGVLESEALSARLEAVIQMDDRRTALRLLDGQGAFAGRLGAQQLLTRAELRASAGRYADALADFDRLLTALAAVAASGDGERALYGRAVCLGHLGQDARARADLVAYQRRFPDGKHAAEVTRLLKGTGSSRRP